MSQDHVFHLSALVILVVILGAGMLFWPVPSLGVEPDPQTGVVLAVSPGLAAAEAGLRVGDRITHIDGAPWPEVTTRLLLVPVPWRAGTPTLVRVARGGTTEELAVRTGRPSPALQVEKLVRGLIALVCWVTGYGLGASPRASDRHLRWAGWVWVLLGGALGLYPPTLLTSYVLTTGVRWVLCTMLAPAAIAFPCWYPPRPTRSAAQRWAGWLPLIVIGAGQIGAISILMAAPATSIRDVHLRDAAWVVGPASVGGSALLLWSVYRTTPVAQLRRQIRLIGAAGLLAGAWAGLLQLLCWLSPPLGSLVPPAAFLLGVVLMPLAYLAGGVRADLRQLEQVVRRVLRHTLTLLTALALLAITLRVSFANGGRSGLLVLTPALVVLVVVMLYAPLYRFMQRRIVPLPGEARRDQALRAAAVQMWASLEAPHLIDALRDGVRAAFLAPPLAIYHRDTSSSPALTRVVAHDLATPATIDPTMLERWKPHGTLLLTTVQFQQGLRGEPHESSLAQIVFHPAVALWGLIRDQQGTLLGVLLLGPRGDDEPYQARDLRELEHLLGITALALTNSASYAAQVTARAELRALHAHAEQIEEQTAADIASDIHDQVLSSQLRLNMEHLAALQCEVTDPRLQERLADVLAGEETIGETLRLVCEQLKPTAHDDPLGLAVSLRQEAKWTYASWRVPVAVELEHGPVPLTRQLHRALVKITHEALINAVTHGEPTAIVVRVRFPVDTAAPLVLMVENDGPRPPGPIEPRRNHWGVRNMREYADAVGATIRWERPEAGGTWVIVEVSPAAIAHTGCTGRS